MVKELLTYIFGIYIKFGCKNPSVFKLNPSILNPSGSVDVATSAEWLLAGKSITHVKIKINLNRDEISEDMLMNGEEKLSSRPF